MSPVAATLRSALIALAVAIIALVVAWMSSTLPAVVRMLTIVPVGISAVTLGLGYLLWFGGWGVLTAWWLVVLAHVVIALPLMTRQLTLARQRLARHYGWAAATLGATPLRQWYSVEVPLLRRAIIAAALFGFAISLGDFAASLLLTRPDAVTAPVYIARLLGRPGVLNIPVSTTAFVDVGMLLFTCDDWGRISRFCAAPTCTIRVVVFQHFCDRNVIYGCYFSFDNMTPYRYHNSALPFIDIEVSMPDFPIVDTHLHLWDPAHFRISWLDGNDVLNKRFLAEEFAQHSRDINVEAAVYLEVAVEPQYAILEAQYINTLARQLPKIKGIVAAAPVEYGEQARAYYAALAALGPRLKGVRRLFQGEIRRTICHTPECDSWD